MDHIEFGAGVSLGDASVIEIARELSAVLIHNYFPPPREAFVLNLASSAEVIRSRSVEFALAAIELSARVGAPFYSVHAGFITDPTSFGKTSFIFPKPTSAMESHRAMDRFVESLVTCVRRAKELGVGLLVENNVCTRELVDCLLLQTPSEFRQLFQLLDSATLGVLMDTGHLRVSASTLGFDERAMIDAVGDRIGAFHVHANDGMTDAHLPLGQSDWVLGLLRRPEFAHTPVVIEAKFSTAKGLRDHVAWIGQELESEAS